MTKSLDDEIEILDSFNVNGDAGERFRALNTRKMVHKTVRKTVRNGTIDRNFDHPVHQFLAQQNINGCWQSLPLDVVWHHWLYKSGSEWPPEEVLGAYWYKGRFCVDYESPVHPWARATMWIDEHARWRACYDSKRKHWLLHRIRLIPEDEKAMR